MSSTVLVYKCLVLIVFVFLRDPTPWWLLFSKLDWVVQSLIKLTQGWQEF